MSQSHVLASDLVAAALRAPSGCPAPERLAAAAAGELSPEEIATIDRHLPGCPSCAADLELARSFGAASPERSTAETEDVDWIVGRLRAGGRENGVRPEAPVVPFRPQRSTSAGWRGWMALAATLAAVGLGLALYGPTRPPAVPQLVGADLIRSARIELETPLGTLGKAPERIAWRAVPDAALYRLEIVSVDGKVVAAFASEVPAIDLPPEATRELETLVRYRVRIEAFDRSGARLAASESFELILEAERR